MPTHPIFSDIRLHSDDELAAVLSAGITERTTMHEWPLSCVQRLTLDNGRRLVYKSQLPPTVEPEFYQQATSPLLPGHQLLGRLGTCETMVLDFIDGPQLRAKASGAEELLAHGRELVQQIGQIDGRLPVYVDVGTPERWASKVDTTLDKVTRLHQSGRFSSIRPQTVRRLAAWAAQPAVIDAATRDARVLHGDLKADQVLLADDGYRVLDWQRPVLACPDLDLVALLEGEDLDSQAHLDGNLVRVFWMLRLQWAAEAQHDLFPDFRGPLFKRWAVEAVSKVLN